MFSWFTRIVVAVNDISFSIQSGQIVGVIGANGAGKTAMLEMMMGIIKE